MTTQTPARARAERYARCAPEGATVEIHEETDLHIQLAQVTVRGSHETICVTVSNAPGSRRTSARASRWYSWSSSAKKVGVRQASWHIANIHVRNQK